MSTYLVGDVHGCYNELRAILEKVNFNSTTDTLWLTGDLVARGPDSLKVLHFLQSLGSSARIVLGNHDLHLLTVHAGICDNRLKDRISTLLKYKNIDELIHWLRYQPILHIDKEKKLIMTHAGINPTWSIKDACKYAQEIEKILKSDYYIFFLNAIYNNKFDDSKFQLNDILKFRYYIDVFTRMRFCFADGQLDMSYKEKPDKVPKILYPWFSLQKKILKEYKIVFGHWASLMGKGIPQGIYGLDTGCCWGKYLTLLCWEDKKIIIQECIK